MAMNNATATDAVIATKTTKPRRTAPTIDTPPRMVRAAPLTLSLNEEETRGERLVKASKQ
jgi:hypothetical protein